MPGKRPSARAPDRRWAADAREAPTGSSKDYWTHVSGRRLVGPGPVGRCTLAVILALAWATCAGAATLDRDIANGSDDYGKFWGLSGTEIMFGGVQGYSANYGQGFRFTKAVANLITQSQGALVNGLSRFKLSLLS